MLLSNLDLSSENHIIFAGNFNLLLNHALDAKGHSPSLKKYFLSKLLKIKHKLDLYDIWWVRNPKKMQYTFKQQHFSGLIQRNSMLIFLTIFKKWLKIQKSLTPFQLINKLFFVLFNKLKKKCSGLWKINNSLVSNEDFYAKMYRTHTKK